MDSNTISDGIDSIMTSSSASQLEYGSDLEDLDMVGMIQNEQKSPPPKLRLFSRYDEGTSSPEAAFQFGPNTKDVSHKYYKPQHVNNRFQWLTDNASGQAAQNSPPNNQASIDHQGTEGESEQCASPTSSQHSNTEECHEQVAIDSSESVSSQMMSEAPEQPRVPASPDGMDDRDGSIDGEEDICEDYISVQNEDADEVDAWQGQDGLEIGHEQPDLADETFIQQDGISNDIITDVASHAIPVESESSRPVMRGKDSSSTGNEQRNPWRSAFLSPPKIDASNAMTRLPPSAKPVVPLQSVSGEQLASSAAPVIPGQPSPMTNMTELIQIMAHEWYKTENTLKHNMGKTEKELRSTKVRCTYLVEQLQTANADKQGLAATIDKQHDKIAILSKRFQSINADFEELSKQMEFLEENSSLQRSALEENAEGVLVLIKQRCGLIDHLVNQSMKAHEAMVEMAQVMLDLCTQVIALQVQAEHQHSELEDKTGLLAEARDEVAIVRSTYLGSASAIIAAIETAQSEICEQLQTITPTSSIDPITEKRLDVWAGQLKQTLQQGFDASQVDTMVLDGVIQEVLQSTNQLATMVAELPIRTQEGFTTLFEKHTSHAIDSLSLELQSIRSRMSQEMDLRREITELTTKLNNTEHRLTVAVHEREDLIGGVAVLRRDNCLLEEKLAKATLQTSLDHLITEKTELEKKLAEANTALDGARERLESMAAAKARAEEEKTKATEHTHEMMARVQEQESRYKQLQEALKRVEFVQADGFAKLLAESKAALNNERRSSDAERTSLRQQLQAARERVRECEEDLRILQKEKDGLVSTHEKHLEDLSALSALKAEIATMREQNQKLSATEDALREAAKAHSQTIDKFRGEIALGEAAFDNLTTSKEEADIQVHELRAVEKRHEEEIVNLGKAYAELEQSAERFKLDVNRMWQNEQQKHEQKLMTMQQAINNQTNKHSIALNELEQTREQCQAAQKIITDETKKYALTEKELKSMREKFEAAQQKNGDLQIELESTRYSLQEYQEKLGTTQLSLQQAQEKLGKGANVRPLAERAVMQCHSGAPLFAMHEVAAYLPSAGSAARGQNPAQDQVVEPLPVSMSFHATPESCGLAERDIEVVKTPGHAVMDQKITSSQHKHSAAANTSSKLLSKPNFDRPEVNKSSSPAFVSNIPPMTPTDKDIPGSIDTREPKRIWRVPEEAHLSSDPMSSEMTLGTSFAIVKGTPVCKQSQQTLRVAKRVVGVGTSRRLTTVTSEHSSVRVLKTKKRKYDDRFNQEFVKKRH